MMCWRQQVCTRRIGRVAAGIAVTPTGPARVPQAVTATAGSGGPVVLFDRLAPVARLGGDTYARVTEVYDMPRPGKEWQARRAGATVVREGGGG